MLYRGRKGKQQWRTKTNGTWREERIEEDKKRKNDWLCLKIFGGAISTAKIIRIKICDNEWKTKTRGKMAEPNCRWKCVENAKIETGLTQNKEKKLKEIHFSYEID